MYRFEQYFQVYKLNLSKTQQYPQAFYAPKYRKKRFSNIILIGMIILAIDTKNILLN